MTNYEKENFHKIYDPMRRCTPACLKNDRRNLSKVTESPGNWNIYTDRTKKAFYCIAKPGTGCESSWFGDRRHIQRMIQEGHIRRSELTRLGRRLILG